MLTDDVIPQLLELERDHYHSSVPKELNHLPVDTDRPSRCRGLRNDGANLATERFDVDSSRRHEPRQDLRRVEPHHRPIAISARQINPGRGQPRLKRPAMSPCSDHDRHTPQLNRSSEIATDQLGQRRVTLVKLDKMITNPNANLSSPTNADAASAVLAGLGVGVTRQVRANQHLELARPAAHRASPTGTCPASCRPLAR